MICWTPNSLEQVSIKLKFKLFPSRQILDGIMCRDSQLSCFGREISRFYAFLGNPPALPLWEIFLPLNKTKSTPQHCSIFRFQVCTRKHHFKLKNSKIGFPGLVAPRPHCLPLLKVIGGRFSLLVSAPGWSVLVQFWNNWQSGFGEDFLRFAPKMKKKIH